jgi:hypothetical protein
MVNKERCAFRWTVSLISIKLNCMIFMYSQTFYQILIAAGRCRPFRVSSEQFNVVYQINL